MILEFSERTNDSKIKFYRFDGGKFLNNTLGSKKLDEIDLKKFAPNIVEGV